MFTDAFLNIESPIHRLDARTRVVAAIFLSVAIAAVHGPAALSLGLAGAIMLAVAARLPLRSTLRRLRPLNLFLAVLVVLLPLTTPGPALFRVYSLTMTWPGILAGLVIAARANAIVLILTALITTMEAADLARALRSLHVPPALVTLLLLTGRYIFVMRVEYQRLRRAMWVRAFRPRTNRHTLRAFGNLVGMLVVKGFDRSERVYQAMKCRGYTGVFPAREPARWALRDAVFGCGTATFVMVMLWVNTL